MVVVCISWRRQPRNIQRPPKHSNTENTTDCKHSQHRRWHIEGESSQRHRNGSFVFLLREAPIFADCPTHIDHNDQAALPTLPTSPMTCPPWPAPEPTCAHRRPPIMLTECWAPCFRIDSGYLGLERASRLIATFTGSTHIVFIFYGVWILCGGQSDTFFSPFFEFSRRDMYVLATLLILYCLLYVFIGSLSLFRAIKSVIFIWC